MKIFFLIVMVCFLVSNSFNLLAEEAGSKTAESSKSDLDDGQNAGSKNNQFNENKNAKKTKKSVIQEAVLGMNVSGNKELPNVLYIVPWKNSHISAKPMSVSRLVDEIYAPVDPQSFSKKVEFYQQLTTKEKINN